MLLAAMGRPGSTSLVWWGPRYRTEYLLSMAGSGHVITRLTSLADVFLIMSALYVFDQLSIGLCADTIDAIALRCPADRYKCRTTA